MGTTHRQTASGSEWVGRGTRFWAGVARRGGSDGGPPTQLRAAEASVHWV